MWHAGADPGFVKRGGGRSGGPVWRPSLEFQKGGGRRGRAPSLALLEDPLWNFKSGARAPCAPPPESASAMYIILRRWGRNKPPRIWTWSPFAGQGRPIVHPIKRPCQPIIAVAGVAEVNTFFFLLLTWIRKGWTRFRTYVTPSPASARWLY